MRRVVVALSASALICCAGCSDGPDDAGVSSEADTPDATAQPGPDDAGDTPEVDEPLPDAIGADHGPPPIDAHPGPDTTDPPDGCCANHEDCPNGESCMIATAAQAGEVLRICVPPAKQVSDHPDACWMGSECDAGVPCVGAVVPGCENPSGVAPTPGICIVDCCATDLDCLTDSAEVKVCAGSGANGLGECKGPGPEPGWCWGAAQCQPGEVCHGVKPCGCQSECKDEHAGVCLPADAVAGGCAPIQSGWVKEWCDAANLVIFDGQQCITTCPGCCECGPFCDLTFTSVEVCEAACKPSSCAVFDGGCDGALPDKPWYYWNGTECVEEDSCVCGGCPGTFDTLAQCINSCVVQPECPEYVTALKDCSYRLDTESGSSCPNAYCSAERCDGDGDCPATGGGVKVGTSCVLGSCAYCWQDSQCLGDALCRGGRCVLPTKTDCPSPGACSDPGCKLVTQSEAPCPVCVCDGMGQVECEDDGQCQLISSFPYKHCVYGRCAECRMDSDCDFGACLPPGICFDMKPHPEEFYGTWIVGWGGGMDHFSYLRFEPDGTLRRGSYSPEGSLADDFPALPCWPDGVLPSPLLGTWQPEITASGFLVLRLRINVGCDPTGGWTGRFVVNFTDGGKTATLKDVDSDWSYQATKAAASACTPDFSFCETPQLF